jgi:DNA-directed RNA polymerase subunit RPC12/RpoP
MNQRRLNSVRESIRLGGGYGKTKYQRCKGPCGRITPDTFTVEHPLTHEKATGLCADCATEVHDNWFHEMQAEREEGGRAWAGRHSHKSLVKSDREDIPREPIESSMLNSVGHDPKTLRLHAEFKNGAVYEYTGVPKFVHKKVMREGGKYFNANVARSYPYEKIREGGEDPRRKKSLLYLGISKSITSDGSWCPNCGTEISADEATEVHGHSDKRKDNMCPTCDARMIPADRKHSFRQGLYSRIKGNKKWAPSIVGVEKKSMNGIMDFVKASAVAPNEAGQRFGIPMSGAGGPNATVACPECGGKAAIKGMHARCTNCGFSFSHEEQTGMMLSQASGIMDIIKGKKMSCNQCQMVSVQGVATHEHGCPNAKKGTKKSGGIMDVIKGDDGGRESYEYHKKLASKPQPCPSCKQTKGHSRGCAKWMEDKENGPSRKKSVNGIMGAIDKAKGKLGSGSRFAAVERDAKGARNPGAVAYAAGVKAHGKKKMAEIAAAGRRRHARAKRRG